ncbi:MAG: response regulator transcription factor [Alphaproteobacteria bacterium]|uniref:Response regulator transcription factor n=1 Tax=Candidatus Nitrobium versatile TaxID=2884831 RepID=A0A953J9W8_9BACT|nr:response regulator transcription factor [Candidatus Nitrobium versatile]
MRVLIIEDDPIHREGLTFMLGQDKDIDIAGSFMSAESAMEFLAASWSPGKVDIVLIDLGLPGMSGVECIRAMKTRYPDIEIVVLTIYEDDEKVFSAIRAGASSYLLKGNKPWEVVEAVKCLYYEGGAFISPKIARRVLTMLKGDSQEVKNILTEREKETLTLIGQGKAYKEIAGILNISIETVKVHIKNIYGKLQAGNKTDALRIARLKGYI